MRRGESQTRDLSLRKAYSKIVVMAGSGRGTLDPASQPYFESVVK